MSEHTKHTEEPWEVYGATEICKTGPDWAIIAQVSVLRPEGQRFTPVGCTSKDFHVSAANARRIVACVNACAGLNPEAVPDVVEAAKWLLERDAREQKMQRDYPAGTCNAEDAWSDFSRAERDGIAFAREALARLENK